VVPKIGKLAGAKDGTEKRGKTTLWLCKGKQTGLEREGQRTHLDLSDQRLCEDTSRTVQRNFGRGQSKGKKKKETQQTGYYLNTGSAP